MGGLPSPIPWLISHHVYQESGSAARATVFFGRSSMKLSWAWASIPCTVTCTGKDGGHVGDDLKGYVFFFGGAFVQ